MEDLEKKIEEAGLNFATRDGHFTINPLNEAGIRATIKGFEAGAKSPEVKEYWQQGMYSEEEVKAILLELSCELDSIYPFDSLIEWFNQNKKK